MQLIEKELHGEYRVHYENSTIVLTQRWFPCLP